MATIKAIDGGSVHQIQSGQVIVDLNSVVKELVENSLDAGATSIDVRFKNHGLDSIEIQDNGKGISPDDFETVALKHHTSKLSSYEDLTSLETFGFRGEALSSLCALSKFHILTARAEDGPVGKRLDFETSGKLKGTSVVAAQKGTTVCVDELFYNLPVRRRELEKSVKREYGKVIALLHAYACISVGVRFAVTNQMPKGKKMTVFSTKANTTTKENIVNVFGTKTLLAIMALDLTLEMEPSKGPSTQSGRNWATQSIDHSRTVKVQGHISKPVFGDGRQASDRQYFFVNSRPCLLPQISKAISEVYKSFNVSQSPFVFANLLMDTNAYDVNVSPDKRTILLHDQSALLESLKTSLYGLFEKTDHTVPQSQLPNKKLPSYQPLTVRRPEPPAKRISSTAASQSDSGESEDESDTSETETPNNRRHATTRESEASPSLIESWACRNAEFKKQIPTTNRQSATTPSDKKVTLEGTKEDPVENQKHSMRNENVSQSALRERLELQDETVDARGTEPENGISVGNASDQRPATAQDPTNTSADDLFVQPAGQVPNRVKQLNDLVAHIHSEKQPAAEPDSAESSESEEPVPAIAPSSQKASPGPLQNAFDRMRPRRTPLQTAEVTIGDKTTTTVIGSGSSFKKRRIHQPVNSQAIAQFGASPLLTRGLRSFAAPGSQMDIDSSYLPQSRPGSPDAADTDTESERSMDDTPARDKGGLFVREDSDDEETSDPLDALPLEPAVDDDLDDDYVDEQEKKIAEDEKVARLIQEAEDALARPTEENLKRASQVLKNGGNRKESTLSLKQVLDVTAPDIASMIQSVASLLGSNCETSDSRPDATLIKDDINDTEAEKRLSLTVSKSDFERMIVVGQFNLGFILAIRPATAEHPEDDLFIIDQHAADEKYNYERLQRTVTLQSQRLVRPKLLELTAIEEEIILNHSDALKANGFEIETTFLDTEDSSGRCFRLLTLPISGEKTFELSDLDELLHLLSEAASGTSDVPRPRKVQRMLAMRACRSSIMVGKTLTIKQMERVVRHMGEMEKPWNCPHGRPTMRHLAGLGAWSGWQEGDRYEDDDGPSAEFGGRETDWSGWIKSR